MKTLTNFRKQTGLTQRQLAGFIGKEHTQLHRFESGERTPCAKSMEHIVVLLKAATQPPADDGPTDQQHQKDFTDHAFGCRVQAQQLGRQLARLENKASQCRVLLNCLTALEIQPQLNVRQKRWIEEQRYQATKRLYTCNTAVQTRLRIRIQLLEMEAALYEAAADQH